MLVITVHEILRLSIWVSLSAEEYKGCERHHREGKHCLSWCTASWPFLRPSPGVLLPAQAPDSKSTAILFICGVIGFQVPFNHSTSLAVWRMTVEGFVGLFFHQISSSKDEIYGGFLGSLIYHQDKGISESPGRWQKTPSHQRWLGHKHWDLQQGSVWPVTLGWEAMPLLGWLELSLLLSVILFRWFIVSQFFLSLQFFPFSFILSSSPSPHHFNNCFPIYCTLSPVGLSLDLNSKWPVIPALACLIEASTTGVNHRKAQMGVT